MPYKAPVPTPPQLTYTEASTVQQPGRAPRKLGPDRRRARLAATASRSARGAGAAGNCGTVPQRRGGGRGGEGGRRRDAGRCRIVAALGGRLVEDHGILGLQEQLTRVDAVHPEEAGGAPVVRQLRTAAS
jgi:hypothetical protein